jgi:group I intron endonuclease
MFLYKITNNITQIFYIGITKKPINKRFKEHYYSSVCNRQTRLCNAIRKYGINNFSINLIREYNNKLDLEIAEQILIKYFKDNNVETYNILSGEYHDRTVKDKESWKNKLKIARVDRKPALGMKHSTENKKIFGSYGKLRWDIYGRYPKEVLNYSFKDANIKYGISKTHYYRLRKSDKN